MPTFISTKAIILNFLQMKHKEYISLDHLQKLFCYIFNELHRQDKDKDYQVAFDLNYDIIERTVAYNSNVFGLDTDAGIMYLRPSGKAEFTRPHNRLDDTMAEIIRAF